MKTENGQGFYRKFNFITTERESRYDTACYEREWTEGDRQTAIKQVEKRGQIAVWNSSDVWSQSNFSRRSLGTVWLALPAEKKPSTIFCAMQFRWTGSPCPHLSWHLCKIMWWRVQLCLEAAVHQKRLWQVCMGFVFFFHSVYKTTAGNTH